MKKSVKYFGIAAATLLTVAPVTTTSVKAATEAANTDTQTTNTNNNTITQKSTEGQQAGVANQQQASNNTNSFAVKNQIGTATTKYFNNLVSSKEYNLGGINLGTLNDSYVHSFGELQNNATIKQLNKNINFNTSDAANTLRSNNVKFVISSPDASNVNDFNKLIDDANDGNSVRIQISAYYNNGGKIADSNIITLSTKENSNENQAAQKPESMDVQGQNLSVDSNSRTVNAKLQSSVKYSATDENGDDIAASSISMGGLYSNAKMTKEFTDASFGASGTYYQPITVTFQDNDKKLDLDKLVANFGKSRTAITIDGVNAKIAQDGTNVKSGSAYTKTDTSQNSVVKVTFTREVNVNNAQQNGYKDESLSSGSIVTAKDGGATVYNFSENIGKMVSANKAFEKGSAYQTDTKRTMNVDGSVYYRVSTNEWVKADEVNFTQKNTDPSTPSNGEYTDRVFNGKAVIKVINGNGASVYNYSDSKGMLSANKSFENNSAWQTTTQRTFKDGSVYYNISTNEWLKASDVTVTQGTLGQNTDPSLEKPYTSVNGTVNLVGSSVIFNVMNTWNGESGKQERVNNIHGDSSWHVDGKATDSEGRVWYRIGANQWVQPGDHGTYKAN